MVNAKDLQSQSVQELHESLSSKREELRTLRFSVSGNQLKDVRSIREVRTDIARILGAISAKKTDNVKK
ncbi:MAG: 50S ribosomal protein L29 [Candidatus Magasanikbacteria bacterium]|nr:50S ribosomal protein L29 [Candidatus Magasanikbacteria bacterium]